MRDARGRLLPGHPPLKPRPKSLRIRLREELDSENFVELLAELKRTDPAGYIKLAIELSGGQRSPIPEVFAGAR